MTQQERLLRDALGLLNKVKELDIEDDNVTVEVSIDVTYIQNDILENIEKKKAMSNEERIAEFEKCKDPVYFYNNYWTVNGEKPPPLRKCVEAYFRRAKELMSSGKPLFIVHKRPRP